MIQQHRIPSLPAALGLGKIVKAPSANQSVRQHLRELRVALGEGWDLVQPIFVRPQWSALDDGQRALHFVLQRDRATRLVTLPETRAVLRFIHQRAWRVQGQMG